MTRKPIWFATSLAESPELCILGGCCDRAVQHQGAGVSFWMQQPLSSRFVGGSFRVLADCLFVDLAQSTVWALLPRNSERRQARNDRRNTNKCAISRWHISITPAEKLHRRAS